MFTVLNKKGVLTSVDSFGNVTFCVFCFSKNLKKDWMFRELHSLNMTDMRVDTHIKSAFTCNKSCDFQHNRNESFTDIL